MARPSNAELVGRYQHRIIAAKKFRREEDYDNTWRRMVDMYRGKHYDHMSAEDRLLVNISFATVNVIAPAVAVNYPKITVNARKPDGAAQAIITEAIVNYWWRRYDVRPEFRASVKDFLIYGHGWLKVGYRYVEEEDVSLEGDPSDAAVEGNEVTPNVTVIEDRPFAERVSPFDVYVDPDATSMANAKWIAQRIRRPLSEVRLDDRYSKAGRDSLSSSYGKSDSDEEADPRQPRDPDEKYVDVWEFYDIAKNLMCIFADGCSTFLVKPRQMPYSFGHPFVMIRNYDVPDYFYPIGDLEAIEPLQRELNAVRTQMMNHRKKYARKYLVREKSFNAQGMNDLESDADNVLVKVIGDEPLADVMRAVPTEMTPPEFYNQSSIIQDDIENVTGVSEYMRGGLSEIRRTATEAAITQDAANARSADKLAQIEQGIAAVAERLVQLAQQFMTGEQVARVTAGDGQTKWVQFDKDYIKGEFDYEVEAGSTAPVNESFRRQSALQIVDALAPFIELGVVNVPELVKHILTVGFGVKNPEVFLQAPPPPMGAPPPEGGLPLEGGMPLDPGPLGPGLGGGQAPSMVDPAVLQALQSRLGGGVPDPF